MKGALMVRLAFAVLLSGAVLVSAALAQSWRLHTYPADGFSVEFPEGAEIQQSPIAVSPETEKLLERTIQYSYDGGSSAFIVALTVARHSLAFENGVKASFESLRCAKTVGDVGLHVPQGSGRELRGRECVNGLRAEARYYGVDRRFYQVLALFERDSEEAAARRFIESFKLVPPR